MATDSPRPGPGGFLPSRSALPSPTPSTASSRIAARLPHPRSRPLVPGSKKEDYARDYVAKRLLHISRRYVKKFGIPDPRDEVSGYDTMEDVCRDLEEVVDVLWFSGTPSLQVPYMLNVALAFNSYLPSFLPAPVPTFAFLRKIDHCFASLLVGYDVKTKVPLPGFVSAVDNTVRSKFSRTEMVRCKSLADEARMIVAMVMDGELDVANGDDEDEFERRPARGPCATSTTTTIPDTFPGPELVKDEEFDSDDDDDDFDFEDVGPEPSSHPKRQAEDSAEDLQAKRIKVEEDGVSSLSLNDITRVDSDLSSTGSKKPKIEAKEQFHWALEDDDDDDSSEDEKPPNDTDSATATHTAAPIGNMPEDEDDVEDYEEVESEDEELQMNVGQVYEKTLSQLGRSLGESITGD
ncbi:hypothetical protein F4808DRAFT_16912 [Astrocystis sublimbata]|nr:hypothetical protein F4808DRAFT_16912 [Astrocystis sublimbata]